MRSAHFVLNFAKFFTQFSLSGVKIFGVLKEMIYAEFRIFLSCIDIMENVLTIKKGFKCDRCNTNFGFEFCSRVKTMPCTYICHYCIKEFNDYDFIKRWLEFRSETK